MYRKLIFISWICLFGSKSLPQIGLTVLTASVSWVLYTLLRPINNKFEDRLQTFVLWILFFNLCLGALYTNWDESQGEGKNDSIFVNVPFVVLNASVLLLAIGKSTCCSALFNMHLSHLPKKSRKVTVDDGGFLNPKFFRFPRNESIMIKSLKGNWRLILSPPPAPFFLSQYIPLRLKNPEWANKRYK